MKQLFAIILFILVVSFSHSNIYASNFFEEKLQKNFEQSLDYKSSIEESIPSLKLSTHITYIPDTIYWGKLYIPNTEISKILPVLFIEFQDETIKQEPIDINTSTTIIVNESKSIKKIEILDIKRIQYFLYTYPTNDISLDTTSNKNTTIYLTGVVEELNSFRGKKHLSRLSIDPTLSRIAYDKAQDMYIHKYMSHTDFYTIAKNSNNKNLLGKRIWENIVYWNTNSIRLLVNSFFDSPAHKYVLQFPDWKHVWIWVFSQKNNTFLVQLFSD